MQYHASDMPQSTSNSKQQGKQQNRTGKKINLMVIYLLNTSHLPELMYLYIMLTLHIYSYIYIYIFYIHCIFIESKYLSEGNICEFVGKKGKATVP